MDRAISLTLAALGLTLVIAAAPGPAIPAPTLACPTPAPELAPARDWIGSLQGWPDSALVRAWHDLVSRAKGRPAGCG
jgi:hypothetical protein